jgi:putative membrane protein
MPSENRLHPLSVLFAFLTQIRLFVVPGIFVLVGRSSRGDGWWEPWMMLLIIPSAIGAVLRYITFRYRYDDSEMVIRSGLIFRKERHIPYARIQNIDAIQNVLHRLLNVVEVKVETGGGETAEARMSVLPMSAFHEMRAHVFAEQRLARPDAPADKTTPQAPLLELKTRELLLYGFIENRGAVVVGAALGVLWEFGLVDRLGPRVVGAPRGRGAMRNLVRDVISDVTVSIDRILIGIAVILALLLLVRVLSMGWAAVRLHGFTLTLIDGDARTEYGLLTRVAATIPLRRIQTLSIRETPLHRLFSRVAVKADTAGGRLDEGGGRADREWLAPILQLGAVPEFVRALLGHAYDGVDWRPAAAGAFRREVKGWLFIAAVMFGGLAYLTRWWAVPVLPAMVVWAVLCAHQTIKHLGWATTDDAILFKRGWLWRRVIIVKFAKMQTVTLNESPFDRRTTMATLHIDTAGASQRSVVHIPYIARDTAAAMHARLSREAAQRQLKW